MAKYNIDPKPTMYGGVQYRSRLEARWAAFFDLMGWEYEYEPEPFKTWSPDFLLQEFGGLYLEVKPYGLWTDENLSETLFDKLKPYAKDYRCGIIAEDIKTETAAFYIGKHINPLYENKGELLLKDIAVQYRSLNRGQIYRAWMEAKNKTMYLNPGK